MKKGIIVLVFILTILVVSAGVSAETYTATGGNENGQYVATLYVDANGNMALALAGVVQGTLNPVTPATPPQGTLTTPAPVPTVAVSQDYILNAQNGQGFAGCSVLGANGNSAGTSLTVASGQATVHQEAGITSGEIEALGIPAPLTMIFAGQTVDDGSYGNSILAQTFAKTLAGNEAGVYVTADGTMNVTQAALAVEGIWDPDFKIGKVIVNGAFASQAGDVGSGTVNNGFACASGLDYLGNFALVGSNVDDGHMVFEQVAVAGDLLITDSYSLGRDPYINYTFAEAWQDTSITGMYGKIYTESYNPGDINHTYAQVEFDNRGFSGSGQLNEVATEGTISATCGSEASFSVADYFTGNLGKDISGYIAESDLDETGLSGDLNNLYEKVYARSPYGVSQISYSNSLWLKNLDAWVTEDEYGASVT